MNTEGFIANFMMGSNPEKGEVQISREAIRELLYFIEYLKTPKNMQLQVFDEAGVHPAQPAYWIANMKHALETHKE